MSGGRFTGHLVGGRFPFGGANAVELSEVRWGVGDIRTAACTCSYVRHVHFCPSTGHWPRYVHCWANKVNVLCNFTWERVRVRPRVVGVRLCMVPATSCLNCARQHKVVEVVCYRIIEGYCTETGMYCRHPLREEPRCTLSRSPSYFKKYASCWLDGAIQHVVLGSKQHFGLSD